MEATQSLISEMHPIKDKRINAFDINAKYITEVKATTELTEALWRYAENFYEAAHLITEFILDEDDIAKLDTYFFVIAFLYRHCIELGLKAIGFQVIITEEDRKTFVKDTKHNLSEILCTIKDKSDTQRPDIRRKQEKERKLQWEREKEMISRELQVQQKEENLGRFLTYLERVAVRGRNHGTGYEVQNIQGQKQSWVGRRDLRLEVNDEVRFDSKASEYDTVMDAFAYDAEQSLEVKQKRSVEKEQMFNRMSELDDVLRVREVKEDDEKIVGHGEVVAIKRRKEKARRLAEKERLKAERKHLRKEKKRKRQKGAADGKVDK